MVEKPKEPSRPRRTGARTSEATVPGEDLAYLRIVSLSREGRRDEARAAAAEYLRNFRDGFRRDEVRAFMSKSGQADTASQ